MRHVDKVNKMMIARFVKRFGGRGGGADDDVVLNVHLNNVIAKKGCGVQTLHNFWDRMCRYIIDYEVRFLVGDFNMALWRVIPEMRARGMQINLLAWSPWMVFNGEKDDSCVRCDTCGSFAIGGITSIRLPFDCSKLGVHAPERESKNRLTQKAVKDETGKATSETVPYELFDAPR